MVDLKRLMDPKTAVAKAGEALELQDAESVSMLASAILIREGLVALARVLDARSGAPGADADSDGTDGGG